MRTPLRVERSGAVEELAVGLRVENSAFDALWIRAVLVTKSPTVLIVAMLSITVIAPSLKLRAQSPSTSTSAVLEDSQVLKQLEKIQQFAEEKHKEEVRELTKQLRGKYEETAQKLKTSERTRDYYKKLFERYDEKWQHTYLAYSLCPPLKQTLENKPDRGAAGARHIVVVHSDFQSPTCREFEKWFGEKIQPIANRHGGVKVVFKQWPICTDCNPNATRMLHPAACRAALAAEAAFLLGGNDAFWRMHDILFATQDQWGDKKKWKEFDFGTYAKQIGLDVERFKQTMNSDEAMQRIQEDIREGANYGQDLLAAGKIKEKDQETLVVDSTPSIYIDGKKLSNWRHAHTWQEILKQPTPPPVVSPQPATKTAPQ